MTKSTSLTYPLIVIDIEASALTRTSYPIEIGVARKHDPGGPIDTWSSLIAPDPSWDMASEWDADAERRIHGISRWALRSGANVREVMERLNELVAPVGHAWCDGGYYDHHWLATLSAAAGIVPQFELRDIVNGLEADQHSNLRAQGWRGPFKPAHRAGPDAERICNDLAQAIAASGRRNRGSYFDRINDLTGEHSKQFDGIDFHGNGNCVKFDNIYAALSPLDVGYKALIFAKSLCQIRLQQARPMPRVYQRPDHDSVSIAEGGLRHVRLTTCKNRICSFLIWGISGAVTALDVRGPGGGMADLLHELFRGLRTVRSRRSLSTNVGVPIGMALALASCAPSNSSNDVGAEESAPPILDLLTSGDITACAHPVVMDFFRDNSRVSFEEAQKQLSITQDQYDAVAPDELALDNISTVKVSKDIAEVKCNANLVLNGRQLGLVEYAMRPAASGDGVVFHYDGLLNQAIAETKSDHMYQLSRTVPQKAAPIRQSAASAEPSPTDEQQAEPPAPASDYDKAKAALESGDPAAAGE